MPVGHAALLSEQSIGFDGQTRGKNYDQLVDALCSNSNVVTTIGNKLWVPWYSSSSSCAIPDLQRGDSCNGGETIDATHNCMVTDEFSQVGILIAMANNQERMDQFFNTVTAIKSSQGSLPAWRIYRSGNSIEACRAGINGNCDTASDATARIIMALFTAANNPRFTNQEQKDAYSALALKLSEDFLRYEVVHSCYPSDQGYGDICWWLAAGSGAKDGGMASTDFAYTGYYGDAIDAMLMACAATNDATYCDVAGNFTLNYLQAARFDGATFTVPPGRSFRWSVGSAGSVPVATCTNTCSPVQWDGADAPRALGICQSNYYAQQLGIALPRLQTYCALWGRKYYTGTPSVPLQFSPDGTASAASQQGYFAGGLEALYQSGGHDASLFAPALDRALAHYSSSSRTWDNAACFGVYTTAFAVRALGFGIGRDEASFTQVSLPPGDVNVPNPAPIPPVCEPGVNDLPVTCTGGTITKDERTGCRTLVCSNGQDYLQVLACDKPDGASPTYFEMYKQKQSGTSVTKICLGQTCISDNGFARDAYPACTQISEGGAAPAPDTSTPVVIAQEASIGIAPWFPQGKSYVFVCDAPEFVPTSYDWNFGDGQRQSGATPSDVYHTYASPGTYTLTCTAKNAGTSASATITVAVQ